MVQKEFTPLLEGGVLKDYQLKGIAWLTSLWHNGLSGILADEVSPSNGGVHMIADSLFSCISK